MPATGLTSSVARTAQYQYVPDPVVIYTEKQKEHVVSLLAACVKQLLARRSARKKNIRLEQIERAIKR